MDHERYMHEALLEAQKAFKKGEYAIGAVVVLDGTIVGRGYNQVLARRDKLAHAEALALAEAHAILFDRPGGALYSTYHPCPYCVGGALLNRIQKIVFGTEIDNSGATRMLSSLPPRFREEEFSMDIIPSVLERECYELFLRSERGQRLAGVYSTKRRKK